MRFIGIQPGIYCTRMWIENSNMSRLHRKISFWQIALLAVLVATILVPIVQLIARSFRVDGGFGLQHYLVFFDAGRSTSLQALWGSVWVSLLSTLFAALIGVPLAFLFERFELPFKNLLGTIAILPVVLPPLVGVVAFMFLLSESGILPRLLQAVLHLERPPFSLSGIQAVIAVHAYSFYVYFFLFIRAALKRLDGATLEAARSLGASSSMVFRRVIFPQIRPAFSAAAVLVFMISMASFSAPFIFAGETRILTVEIYNSKLQGNMSMAITQSVMLAAISLLFLGLALRGERRFLGAAQKGLPLPPRPIRSTWARAVAAVLAALAGLILILPHLTLFLLSFVKNGTWTSQLLPDTFTLENYWNLLREPNVAEPVINSLKMATLATLGNVLLAVALAYWNVRGRWRWGSFSEILVMLPWAIPGTVIAIALIVAFNQPRWLTFGQVLVGTFWILPLAYFIRHLPVVYRACHAAFTRFDPALEEAARSLGASGVRVWRKVILPAIRPGLLAGGLLALVMSLGEFVSSILLYTFSNRPISVAILSEIRLFNLGSAAAYGMFLTILIFGITYISSRWGELE